MSQNGEITYRAIRSERKVGREQRQKDEDAKMSALVKAGKLNAELVANGQWRVIVEGRKPVYYYTRTGTILTNNRSLVQTGFQALFSYLGVEL